MKSKLFIIPLLSVTFLFSGCGSDNSIDENTTETTEVTTEQTTEATTIETTTETETTTNQITTKTETTTEDLESKKQAAIEKDKEIWATVNLSEVNTKLIQEVTNSYDLIN